ncbi:MAG: hypothetical protein R2792_01505 [Saprospiraceae bacterium]
MAKTPSDKLFRLVKALTPAEKRYFKLYIKGKSERDSKYLRLFEAICTMQEFDEEALRKKIYKNQQLESQKYSELKAYLYELILRCLQQYDEQNALDYRLNHLLQSVAALYKRGHYDDCKDLLNKANRLAKQYESFTHLIDIIRWEKQLAYAQMDADFFHRELDRLQFEENRALELLDNAAAYRRAFFAVYATVKREALLTSEERIQKLRSLLEQDLFADPNRALSHKARVMYYRAINLYHYSALDQEAFYESGKKLIELLESQPHFLKESLSEYIAALSNYILSCGLLQRYEEVRESLAKLRQVQPITVDDQQKIHRQYYTSYFVLCIYTGEFEAAKAEMRRCQEEADRLHLLNYETASFYFQYCCISFGCGEYSDALDHLNTWLGQPRTVEREDLQSLARILSLIIHFELGNSVLLESLLRSATRFMQKKNRLFNLERRFMLLISELMRAANPSEEMQAFTSIQTDLEILSHEPTAKALLQTFDLAAWLESKIRKKPFAAVVQEKFQMQAANSQ